MIKKKRINVSTSNKWDANNDTNVEKHSTKKYMNPNRVGNVSMDPKNVSGETSNMNGHIYI